MGGGRTGHKADKPWTGRIQELSWGWRCRECRHKAQASLFFWCHIKVELNRLSRTKISYLRHIDIPQISLLCLCCAWLLSRVRPCNPMDCSPPGSSVLGIFQARTLEWVAIPFSRGSFQSRDWTQVSCTAGGFFTEPPGKPSALPTCIQCTLFKKNLEISS